MIGTYPLRSVGVATTTLIIVAVETFLFSATALAWSEQQTARTRAILSQFVSPKHPNSRARPPGLSIAVGVDGELVMAEGFGDDGHGHTPDADTVYRIGSITKQFTAATILRLIELGAVADLSGKTVTLDLEVSDIIEDVESWTQPGQSPITVRSLLSMTSNLPNFTRRPPPHLDPWGAIALPELLGAVKKLRPEGWPSSFEYSNTSYFILAAIADRVHLPGERARLEYRSAVKTLMLQSAELAASGFADTELRPRMARPVFRRKPAFGAPDWLRGSGDMVSSVRDIWKWNASLIGGKVIGKPLLREMFGENARVTPTIYYGMGWYVTQLDGVPLYTHTGSVPGYTSINAICRDERRGHWVSVSILSNADGVEDMDDLAETLIRIAFEK